ncbi:MAG: putative sulfate exporter family transporter [Alphaproteobacteria bacterium]|nr:putative sulfate exporter family transporter [Alphaproteobacteria bacterium]MBL6939479.1 putative sulfate exporter family transporter [Alphaproteobacteria bacterium]MBL7097040.1 putative sulfate exporter family transporter [Alphaproteobacteria bacterium]
MSEVQTRRLGFDGWNASGLAAVRRLYPGLIAAGTIGLAATWLGEQYKSPVMLFALLIGMAFNFLYEEGPCLPGIDFASKNILRVGVALLGARITVTQILGLGLMPLATVLVGTGSTILLGAWAARRLGLSRSFGLLSGGSVGICGASAALAISSVLPKGPEGERDTILTVVIVTAFSTLAMILYPLLAGALHLGHAAAGIFLGGTIHDVAQVEGAGYTISLQTGDIATYVKLLRVSMLLPVVLSIGFFIGKPGAQPGTRLPMPLFLLAFAGLVALGSMGAISKSAVAMAGDASRWCLVTAVAALGIKTSFGAVVKAGWKPVALMLGETAWIAGIVLGAVLFWK